MRRAALPLAVLLLGAGASMLVAALAGMPLRDLVAVMGLAAAGAVVAAAGLGVEAVLRRGRAPMARLAALTATVTVAAVLAAMAAVTTRMLVSQHDFVVLLVTLPVAAAAGIAFGILSAWRTAADLRALAGRAGTLADEVAGGPPPATGPAEVVAVAEALEGARARLTAARERERAAEASRRDLVAWASHDLRTPLASLRAVAEALADDLAVDEADRRRYLASLTANVERLARLVDDLLALSRIDAGALEFELEPVWLPEVIEDVVGRFAPGAEREGVSLGVAVGDGLPVVAAGRDEVGRALANLVANAIGHTPPGGRVEVGARPGEGWAEVRVRDGCGGIPEADLPHVFERMWRGDPARSTAGSGLGLAIARGLVEAHGGGIAVANAGAGCQFTFWLPAASRPVSR